MKLTLAVLLPLVYGQGDDVERSTIDVQYFDNCPNIYTSRARNLTLSLENPIVRFEPGFTKVHLESLDNPLYPHVFNIPGCMLATISNVRFNRELRDLIAEHKIRIGNTPLPITDTGIYLQEDIETDPFLMACGKSRRRCANPARCGDPKNNCVSGNVLQLDPDQAHGQRSKWDRFGLCGCGGTVKPGLYTIKTEICTPDKERMQSLASNQILELLSDDQQSAHQMWATIWMYDRKADKSEYDPSDPAYWQRRHHSKDEFELQRMVFGSMPIARNRRTVACFLMKFKAKMV